MSKIKKQSANSKISSNFVNEKCSQNPSFSFEHLTLNGGFNFEYFGKDSRARLEAKSAVYDRLQDISSQSWLYWGGINKRHGYETIKADEMNFNPSNYEFSNDEKVFVFRLSYLGNDCRIIGVKKSPCSTYYVIGFDFNHNAYNHGS